MRAIILLLLATFAVPCAAGQIFKCKGPKGEVTFSNIKCPDNAQVEHYGAYERAADQPAQPADARQESFRQQDAEVGATPQAAPRLAQQPAAGGYRCHVNGKTWVQAEPCPETSTDYQAVHVDGYSTRTGEPIEGTASVEVVVPVEQKVISRDELCDSISKRERIAERGKDADSGYERRKLAHANCGR